MIDTPSNGVYLDGKAGEEVVSIRIEMHPNKK
jgi:hypothetical protein